MSTLEMGSEMPARAAAMTVKSGRKVGAASAAHCRESGETRRLEIAAAARQLIVEKGLEGLRTREIADRVGINIATLHYHVPSKEALIELVAESAKAEFQARAAAVPTDGLSPPELLRQEIDRFIDLVAQRRELLFVVAELRERARRDSMVARIYGTMQARCENTMRVIFEAGQADGSLRGDIPPETAASILYGTLVGCVKPPAPAPEEYEKAARGLERLFLTDPPK